MGSICKSVVQEARPFYQCCADSYLLTKKMNDTNGESQYYSDFKD